MQAWRKHPQITTAVPAPLVERLGEFAGDLWTAALELANGRLQAEREALERLRQEAEQMRQEAVGLADQLAAELDTARATVDRQAAQLAADAETIDQLRETLRIQKRSMAAATYRANISEVARMELQARVDQLTELLWLEQAARQEAEERVRAAVEEAAQLRGRLAAFERPKE
ncbi:DNA-binding protein [Candidatus Methylocalor cossyra]|uniref:KfrA N-terminal DNA-binding domain-containing protein n=1 Tax=Candidatus Methylocalor cossyra TaxID=3108543 RepID=A0ABP1C9G7_9GAMM